jgi:hypothetical protein
MAGNAMNHAPPTGWYTRLVAGFPRPQPGSILCTPPVTPAPLEAVGDRDPFGVSRGDPSRDASSGQQPLPGNKLVLGLGYTGRRRSWPSVTRVLLGHREGEHCPTTEQGGGRSFAAASDESMSMSSEDNPHPVLVASR